MTVDCLVQRPTRPWRERKKDRGTGDRERQARQKKLNLLRGVVSRSRHWRPLARNSSIIAGVTFSSRMPRGFSQARNPGSSGGITPSLRNDWLVNFRGDPSHRNGPTIARKSALEQRIEPFGYTPTTTR